LDAAEAGADFSDADEMPPSCVAFAGRRGIGMGILLLFLCHSLSVPLATAQELDAAALLKPATDTWPSYNGDYSGRRYSQLDQINAGNVNSLTLAWAFNTRGSCSRLRRWK